MNVTAERAIVVDACLTLQPFTDCPMEEYLELRSRNYGHLAQFGEADDPRQEDRGRMVADWMKADMHDGKSLDYAIRFQGMLAGVTGLSFQYGKGEAEGHYWVDHEMQRRGLASSSTAAVVRYAFAAHSIQSVKFLIRGDNLASQRVAQKVGARYVSRINVPSGDGQRTDYHIWRLRRGY